MTETRAYRTFTEKATWGYGPWIDEPDKMQWRDDATGLACLAVRNRYGAWCGYVGVPPTHPLHGVDYFDDRLLDADVHGGLTYCGDCEHGDEATAICHVPAAGEPDDVWWLGFDCGHTCDYTPGRRSILEESLAMRGVPRDDSSTAYRTLDYVRGEVARLAQFLAGVAAEC